MNDVHSYGQLVLLPWGYTTSPAPGIFDITRVAEKVCKISNPLGIIITLIIYQSCRAGQKNSEINLTFDISKQCNGCKSNPLSLNVRSPVLP